MDRLSFSLQGKVAIVTGASRGIGAAIAIAFAESGADVVVSSRKKEGLLEIADKIEAMGKRVSAIPAHMGKSEDITNLAEETVKQFGRIDVLVNNAGTNPVMASAIDTDIAVWDKIMDVNLKGYFLCARACVEYMKKGGGKIINISSVAAKRYIPGLGVYSISKAGVDMLTKVLSVELAPFGINVNGIAPGIIKTRFSQALWQDEAVQSEAVKSISLQRLGEPEDVAGAALYLASSMADYVTGETIVIDGGST